MAADVAGPLSLARERATRWSETARACAPVLAASVAAAYLLVMRRPDSITSPTMWAEDGLVFFRGAIQDGASSLFDGYGGQLLLVHRVVALTATAFPVSWQPAIYAVFSLSAAVGSCALVLSSRWYVPVPFYARVCCLIALIVSPAIDEVLANLTNVHWWFAIGVLILGFLHDPKRRSTKVLELGYVAATALSGFAILYGLPALVLRMFRQGSRHSRLLVLVAGAGVAAELAYLQGSTRAGDASKLSAGDGGSMLLVLFKKVFGVAALGDVNLEQLWPGRSAVWWVWAIALLLFLALTLLFVRLEGYAKYALLACVAGGWVLAVWSTTLPESSLDLMISPVYAGRYFVVPIAALYLLVLMSAGRRSVRRPLLMLVLALLGVGAMSDYHLAPRSHVDWSPFARCVEEAKTACAVQIPPGWTLEIDSDS